MPPELATSTDVSDANTVSPVGESTLAPPPIDDSVVPSRRFLVKVPVAAASPAAAAPEASAIGT